MADALRRARLTAAARWPRATRTGWPPPTRTGWPRATRTGCAPEATRWTSVRWTARPGPVDAPRMTYIELDLADMREIASSCVAPSAAQLFDRLDDGSLEDVLIEAVAVRDAAQAIIEGRVRA